MPSLRLISELVNSSRRCAAASRMSRARRAAVAGLASERDMETPETKQTVHSIECLFKLLNNVLPLAVFAG